MYTVAGLRRKGREKKDEESSNVESLLERKERERKGMVKNTLFLYLAMDG
jgi:hypothetical protein